MASAKQHTAVPKNTAKNHLLSTTTLIDCRHAIDQRCRAQQVVFRRVFWDRCVLFGACHYLICSLAKTRRGLSARRQSALSRWHDRRDNRTQRAAERCAGRSRPFECRRWSRVDGLSQEVDGLESPPDRSGPGRSSFVYRWTFSCCF